MSAITNDVIDILVQLGMVKGNGRGGVEPVALSSGTGATKLVGVASSGAASASGVATTQPLTTVTMLDTHSLVDTVSGTILIPSDASIMSIGVATAISLPGDNGLGTVRKLTYQVEIFDGFWVDNGARLSPANLAVPPQSGPMNEMLPVDASWKGKKIRFQFTQDSGISLTPGNLRFYAQFITL